MKYTKEQIQLVLLFVMARDHARRLADAGKIAQTLSDKDYSNILPAKSEQEILKEQIQIFAEGLKESIESGDFSIDRELQSIENIVKIPNL